MASAQVKSCVLLAGLFAEGDTIVREPVRTRDHTEIALREFGADISTVKRDDHAAGGREAQGPGAVRARRSFLGVLFPGGGAADEGRRAGDSGRGLNPTRSALLDYLAGMGASIKVLGVQQHGGELIGDLRVRASAIHRGAIDGPLTAALIDEIPALAVLGAAAGGLTVRDASELRVKETDRIATLEANFKRMGVEMETTPDGFHVAGGQKFHAAELDSCGRSPHRDGVRGRGVGGRRALHD